MRYFNLTHGHGHPCKGPINWQLYYMLHVKIWKCGGFFMPFVLIKINNNLNINEDLKRKKTREIAWIENFK
jgi:hypothetical protein